MARKKARKPSKKPARARKKRPAGGKKFGMPSAAAEVRRPVPTVGPPPGSPSMPEAAASAPAVSPDECSCRTGQSGGRTIALVDPLCPVHSVFSKGT